MVNASLFSNPALISYSDSLLEKRLSDPPWDMDTRAGEGIKCIRYLVNYNTMSTVLSITVKKVFFMKKTILHYIFLLILVSLSLSLIFYLLSNSLNTVLSCVQRKSTIVRQYVSIGGSIMNACGSRRRSITSRLQARRVYW